MKVDQTVLSRQCHSLYVNKEKDETELSIHNDGLFLHNIGTRDQSLLMPHGGCRRRGQGAGLRLKKIQIFD